MYVILSFYACCNNITQQYIINIFLYNILLFQPNFKLIIYMLAFIDVLSFLLPMFNSDILKFSAPRKQCKFSTRKRYICYLLIGNEDSK